MLIPEVFDGRRYHDPVEREGVKDWWLERDENRECWRIEVRDDGSVWAVAFTRPVTVEYRLPAKGRAAVLRRVK